MCNEFLSEKEQIKENARNEVQNEIVNLKLERDNEIQKIYKRLVCFKCPCIHFETIKFNKSESLY